MLVQKSSVMTISNGNINTARSSAEIVSTLRQHHNNDLSFEEQELPKTIPSKWIKTKQEQNQQSQNATLEKMGRGEINKQTSTTANDNNNNNNKEETSLGTSKKPIENTKSNMIVFVLSERSNFERRQLIRETWGKTSSSSKKHQIYFIVGSTCHIPLHQRKHELGCELENKDNDNDMSTGLASQREVFLQRSSSSTTSRLRLPEEWVKASEQHMEKEHHESNRMHTQKLIEEINTFKDILSTDAPESYRGLPHKLRHSIQWLYKHTKAQWFTKVDDDMIVRIPSLEQFIEHIEKQQNETQSISFKDQPTIIGDIIYDSEVAKDGKWADLDYDKWTYPPWPRGASGYVFNRPVAKYIVDNFDKLFISQGEDTSMGIWMDEAPFQANFISNPRKFVFEVQCYSSQALIVGHAMSPHQITKCYQRYGSTIQDTQVTQLIQLIMGRSILSKVLLVSSSKTKVSSFAIQELFRCVLRTLLIDVSKSCNSCPYLLGYVWSLKAISPLSSEESSLSWRGLTNTLRDLTITAESSEQKEHQYDSLVHRCVYLHWNTMKERNITSTNTMMTSSLSKENRDDDAEEENGNVERKVASAISEKSDMHSNNDNIASSSSTIRSNHEQYSLKLPDKVVTKSTMIVMVLSARDNFERRQAIRDTWGYGHTNIYFVVGSPCHVPIHRRTDELECEEDITASDDETRSQLFMTKESGESVRLPSAWLRNATKELEHQHQLENRKQHEKLVQEQRRYNDLLWIDAPESYRGLPYKLRDAVSWFYKHTNDSVRWFLKVDDDIIVRVGSLELYLLQDKSASSSSFPVIVGDIQKDAAVATDGKWADPKYMHATYPPWPRGASGYAINRIVAKYVSEQQHTNKLFISQGEDTSMGIWMDEAPFRDNVQWSTSKSFVFDGDCSRFDHLSIGHDLTPEKIRECYQQYGDGLDVYNVDVGPIMRILSVINRLFVAVFFGSILFVVIVIATAQVLLLCELLFHDGVPSSEMESSGEYDYDFSDDEGRRSLNNRV